MCQGCWDLGGWDGGHKGFVTYRGGGGGGGEGGGVGKISGETRVVLKILLNQPLSPPPPHLIINDSSLIRI